jgi:ABC-2 type transport system permease protein
VSQLGRALAISRKDFESYYGKPPLITWGLLFPAVLLLAVYVRNPAGYLNVAPGIIAMTLLFGNTSMAAIVVTFEKRSGTLQRLLLAPLTFRTIVLGKAVSAASFGIGSSLVLAALLAALFGMRIAQPVPFALGLALGALVFSLAGLTASVMVREVFEAMTFMNFVRFPLLFISGVFIPLAAMPNWAKPFAIISPLTHVVELLRQGISGGSYFVSPWIPAVFSATFTAVAWFAAVAAFRSRARR